MLLAAELLRCTVTCAHKIRDGVGVTEIKDAACTKCGYRSYSILSKTCTNGVAKSRIFR